MESNEEAWNINSLPEEMLINIFSYLVHNELGQIARVCRTWNVLTRSPALWKKVNVVFHKCQESHNNVTRCFLKTLQPCVTRIRLRFRHRHSWTKGLNFKEFSLGLQERCPRLEMLILENAFLSETLPSVIDLCIHFLQDVKILIFDCSVFTNCLLKEEFGGTSKIEVLDLSWSCLGCCNKLPFSRMPHLKQLRSSNTNVGDSWFEDDSSFLNQLNVLDLGETWIGSRLFQAIRNHGHNLKELYVCFADLKDDDLNFNNSTFPHLKTICLRRCQGVTCEGVVSLVQSCQSLQNAYVDFILGLTFNIHPFTVANKCKLGIVKGIFNCNSHRKVNYPCQ